MARVWRDGQKRRTYIYRLISADTIEEKIYQRQISKQGLSGVVVDAKQSDTKQMFTPEQLRELFQAPEGSQCSTHDLLKCECLREENSFDDHQSTADPQPLATAIVRQCQLMTNRLTHHNHVSVNIALNTV